MTMRMKSMLISTTAPSGTAIRTGSGTLALLLSSNIGIGVRLVELEVVESLGEVAGEISVGEDSKVVVTLCMMVKKEGVGVGVSRGVKLGVDTTDDNGIEEGLSNVELAELTL